MPNNPSDESNPGNVRDLERNMGKTSAHDPLKMTRFIELPDVKNEFLFYG